MKRTLYSWFLLLLLVPNACETTDPATLPRNAVQNAPVPIVSGSSGTALQVLAPANTTSASHPLQIDAMRAREYPGSDIVIERVLDPGVNYNRYYVSYRSEGLKIYALMTVPMGEEPATGWPVIIFNHGFIPPDLLPAWEAVTAQALSGVENAFQSAPGTTSIRLHGDCHAGNVLWTEDGPHFVDLDDARMGPAVQDLWMLLSGDRASMTSQLQSVLAGYELFAEFDRRELLLLEALRTLRLIHYSAWIARRWDDAAFPAAFPWFNTQRYWQDRILELREQIALMQEEPLAVD